MNKHIIIFILLVSCSNPDQELLVINPLKFPEETFTLSHIANDIDYLTLDDTLLFNKGFIKMNQLGIFISSNEHGLMHFNSEGRFIRTIGKVGRGPGEYRFCNRFTVDEINRKAFIIDRGKIKIYSLEDGAFMRDILTTTLFPGNPDYIEFFKSSLFLADYGINGESIYNWVILDTLGNLVSKRYNIIQPPGFILFGSTYKFNEKIYYYNYLNDTIFSISQDWSFQPEYLFSQGKYRWPHDIQINSITRQQGTQYFRPGTMFETKNFIYLFYAFLDRSAILLIEKKNNKSYLGYQKKREGVLNFVHGISNDLDGGLPFLSEPIFFYYNKNGDESIITLINPYDLRKHVASDGFKKYTPLYPEKKKELERLANSLNENDNPVLMIVKLKD